MTNKELIETLKSFPEDATGERFFDVGQVESLIRVRVTTAGVEMVETVVIGI